MPPAFYIVAEEIGTAYWIEDGAVVGCAIQVDGTPDWANTFDAQFSGFAEISLKAALGDLAEHVARVKADELERP